MSNPKLQPKPQNPAFDNIGLYGGDQNNPIKRVKELAGIVRYSHPDFTDEEVEKMLQKLRTEGCGYIAMINTIFAEFVGREYEFGKTFGFEMYDENGELNYDMMALDFYATMDNHNEKSFLFFRWDELNELEDLYYPNGYGTTVESRAYRWKTYLEKHGMHVSVKNVHVTLQNFEELAKKGSIVVGITPCILFDETGKEISRSENGHAMTVTGVTENGFYKVSSWGKVYYMKAETGFYNVVQFQQVIYDSEKER